MLHVRGGKWALSWSNIFLLPLQCLVLQGLIAIVIQARKGSFLQAPSSSQSSLRVKMKPGIDWRAMQISRHRHSLLFEMSQGIPKDVHKTGKKRWDTPGGLKQYQVPPFRQVSHFFGVWLLTSSKLRFFFFSLHVNPIVNICHKTHFHIEVELFSTF